MQNLGIICTSNDEPPKCQLLKKDGVCITSLNLVVMKRRLNNRSLGHQEYPLSHVPPHFHHHRTFMVSVLELGFKPDLRLPSLFLSKILLSVIQGRLMRLLVQAPLHPTCKHHRHLCTCHLLPR